MTELDVIWVGRIDSQKDPGLVLDAAEAALAAGLSFRFRLVGDGPLRASLESRIVRDRLSNVELVGPKAQIEVASLLRGSKVFLMSSHYEGSPTALVEALASGLPAVVTRESDPDGIVVEGVNGSVVTTRTGWAIVAALEAVRRIGDVHVTEQVAARSACNLVPRLASAGDVLPGGLQS
ncbi:glycosyltransferase [Kocuria rosea]|uniref:glycosyltransferase n=1 Tax=Kocuria rosea TaxID=1275 RepID=UPI00253FF476|nr:glycosyltransferase [Kocuria rosea]WIG16363.1 glycosyltransferase [Kocuria rosea]